MEKSKDILDDIDLRSENVQDILTRPPHLFIRWGNTIIFAILLMVLLMSYLIKYPDFVTAPIVVTSQNPPEKIEARINSKIEKILVKDHQYVRKNQVMMVLESAADYGDILILKGIVDSISSSQATSFPIEKVSTFKLGEIQEEYNGFAKALQDEKLFTRLQPYAPENIAANQTLAEYRARIATLQQQKKLEFTKFDLTKKNYQRSQELFNQGVIAATELESEKIKFIEADQNLKNINIELSQAQEAISNLHKTKSGASISNEKDKITYTSQTLQLFEQLRKALRQWEQNYLIISSTEGKVSFQQFWGENQFVKQGDIVMSVLPKSKESIVGRMLIPSINSGKVKPNQKVLIKLDNYRYQEYGIVEGKVQNISLTPNNEGSYYVDIILPKRLKTSFNKELPFDKELRGNAEIITQDLRLIERFFHQIMQLMRYQN